jgi:hypothetical protein
MTVIITDAPLSRTDSLITDMDQNQFGPSLTAVRLAPAELVVGRGGRTRRVTDRLELLGLVGLVAGGERYPEMLR